ncbi:MAG: RrF2 family transcriptional regulator [Planctomycetota bacterium]|jgi:Rrf2 family protein
MQVSQSAGYAIHGLLFLHLYGAGKPIQLSTIAKGLRVSESYLSKIFQTLAKSSLVSSFRGAKGGFILLKQAEEITLREVIEMIDGSIIQAKCCLGRPNCNERDKCNVYRMFYDMQRTIYDSLENISVVDLNPSFFENQPRIVTKPRRKMADEEMGTAG